MATSPSPDVRERILVVEDDAAQRVGLQQLIRRWGYLVEVAADGEEALAKADEVQPDIVLTDLVMPKMSGLDLLHALRTRGDDTTVVILTAQGTVETAVDALKDGAYDYLTKPVDLQRLKILLEKVAERQATLRQVRALRRQLVEHGTFGTMIGQSTAMRAVYRIVEQAAPTTASVLVTGESGTGKELVAQTIHRLSPRVQGPFVPINCAAIPETLLESELFGHEKGAFTGAIDRREGCFDLANGGTLFLDEVAEMSPTTQVKFLRVLQERRFRPLGGRQEREVDIRVVAATNVEPQQAVREGRLRSDLYYRLNVFSINLPPLRDRMEDLPLLVQAFLTEFNQRNQRAVVAVDDAAMRVLQAYTWPGNVRELRNAIERATIVADGRFIQPKDLPSFAAAGAASSDGPGETGLSAGMTVDEAERRLILLTLAHTNNNKTRAAELLGISLKTLHNKLNRLKDEAREPDAGV